MFYKMWFGGDWMCSIKCGFSVHSNLFVLRYYNYALSCSNIFRRISYRNFESLSRSSPMPLTISP